MQEIGGDTPLETCLAEAKEAGFVGMELGHKFPRRAGGAEGTLAEFGLTLSAAGIRPNCSSARRATSSRRRTAHIAMLKAMGSDIFIVAETSNAIHGDRSKPLSSARVCTKTTGQATAQRMTAFADTTARRGPRAWLPSSHGHDRPVGARHRRASWLPPGRSVHLLLDTGHATWGGADPARLARALSCPHRPCPLQGRARGDMMREGERRRTGASSIRSGARQGTRRLYGAGRRRRRLRPPCSSELKGYSGWVVVEAEQDPEEGRPARLRQARVSRI